MPVGEKPVMADALKSIWENMQEEAAPGVETRQLARS
jgi:hypothetical protein